MSRIVVRRWSDEHSEPLTLEAIRRVHLPLARHRVSRSAYPPGASFPGNARAGWCYVLDGACRYSVDLDDVTLQRGHLAMLPEGRYQFEVVGDREVVIVRVWELTFDQDGKLN